MSQPSEAFSYLFTAFHSPFGLGLAPHLIPLGVGCGVAGPFSLQCLGNIQVSIACIVQLFYQDGAYTLEYRSKPNSS